MEAEVRRVGNVHVVKLQGQLKLGEPVDRLRSAVDGLVNEGFHAIVANMSEVPMADSSGVGALVRYQSALRKKGGALKLVQPSKLVVQTLKILGLLSVFECFDDETAAVESFPEATTTS